MGTKFSPGHKTWCFSRLCRDILKLLATFRLLWVFFFFRHNGNLLCAVCAATYTTVWLYLRIARGRLSYKKNASGCINLVRHFFWDDLKKKLSHCQIFLSSLCKAVRNDLAHSNVFRRFEARDLPVKFRFLILADCAYTPFGRWEILTPLTAVWCDK